MCTEPTLTGGQTESSTELPAAPISQPLTRADCGKAGLLWDEGANVSAESSSTAGQAEAGPDARSSSVLITIDKTHQKMTIFVDGQKNMTGGCQRVDQDMQPLLELTLLLQWMKFGTARNGITPQCRTLFSSSKGAAAFSDDCLAAPNSRVWLLADQLR